MNTAHSNYTGRFKRTQSEAFGPYTSNSLEPMQEADSVMDVALVLASVAAVALAVMAIFVFWRF